MDAASRNYDTLLEVVPDLPRPGCQTLMVRTFSGGAHCCTEAVLVVRCPHQEDCLQTLDLQDSPELRLVDLRQDGRRQMKILDWSLSYFTVEQGGKSLSISFAASPGLRRLLVWDQGSWRPDRPGEFAAYHHEQAQRRQGQLAQGQAVDPEYVVGWLVARAYQQLMAGQGTEEVAAQLRQDLPPDWLPAWQVVLDQISQAIHGFQPQRPLAPLSEEPTR